VITSPNCAFMCYVSQSSGPSSVRLPASAQRAPEFSRHLTAFSLSPANGWPGSRTTLPMCVLCECGYTRAEYDATNVAPTQKGQPLIEEEAPFPTTQMVFELTKTWSWVPTRPEANNDCAGEVQQQFSVMLRCEGLCPSCQPRFNVTL
jgi:hypothetical protein